MNTSSLERSTVPLARHVECSDTMLTVELSDGRKLSVPLDWYPRLRHAQPHERANWKLLGKGDAVHWPDLDEDLSVEGMLAGRRSGETEASFQRWMEARPAR